MEILVKQGTRRIDSPLRDPDYARAVKVGQFRLSSGRIKFQSEGDRRDYEKRVASNPNNVPGLPAFFPPVSTRVVCGGSLTEADIMELRMLKAKVRYAPIFCPTCNSVQIHYLSDSQGFCESCKTKTKFRSS